MLSTIKRCRHLLGPFANSDTRIKNMPSSMKRWRAAFVDIARCEQCLRGIFFFIFPPGEGNFNLACEIPRNAFLINVGLIRIFFICIYRIDSRLEIVQCRSSEESIKIPFPHTHTHTIFNSQYFQTYRQIRRESSARDIKSRDRGDLRALKLSRNFSVFKQKLPLFRKFANVITI